MSFFGLVIGSIKIVAIDKFKVDLGFFVMHV